MKSAIMILAMFLSITTFGQNTNTLLKTVSTDQFSQYGTSSAAKFIDSKEEGNNGFSLFYSYDLTFNKSYKVGIQNFLGWGMEITHPDGRLNNINQQWSYVDETTTMRIETSQYFEKYNSGWKKVGGNKISSIKVLKGYASQDPPPAVAKARAQAAAEAQAKKDAADHARHIANTNATANSMKNIMDKFAVSGSNVKVWFGTKSNNVTYYICETGEFYIQDIINGKVASELMGKWSSMQRTHDASLSYDVTFPAGSSTPSGKYSLSAVYVQGKYYISSNMEKNYASEYLHGYGCKYTTLAETAAKKKAAADIDEFNKFYGGTVWISDDFSKWILVNKENASFINTKSEKFGKFDYLTDGAVKTPFGEVKKIDGKKLTFTDGTQMNAYAESSFGRGHSVNARAVDMLRYINMGRTVTMHESIKGYSKSATSSTTSSSIYGTYTFFDSGDVVRLNSNGTANYNGKSGTWKKTAEGFQIFRGRDLKMTKNLKTDKYTKN